MFKQFIGKPFYYTLLGQILFSVVAAVGFYVGGTSVLLALIGLGVFVLSLWKLELGFAVVFAELFANSHGHLISSDIGGFSLSVRMVLFIALMLAWLIRFIKKDDSIHWQDRRLIPFLILGFTAIYGLSIGAAQNEKLAAFQDGNAYFYLLYIFPMLSVQWTALKQRMLLQVLAASTLWVVMISWGILFLYTHFPEEVLVPIYKFYRDTRTGEVTRLDGGLYRVFMQSQFFVMVMVFLYSTYFWVKGASKRDWKFPLLALSATMTIVLVSMSRSFWVGMAAGVLVFVGLIAFFAKPTWKRILSAVGFTALAKVVGVLMLAIVVFLPLPGGLGFPNLFGLASRTSLSDEAVSSRWKLLDPMAHAVKENPILGYGFGEEIEFITDDPRICEIDPECRQRTYALEWGWLEIWMKMGIFGVAAFLFVFVSVVKQLWPLLGTKKSWLGVAFISSIVMLFSAHVFSPFLNHPIGLGFLIFLMAFVPPATMKFEGVKVGERLKMKQPRPEMAVLNRKTE